MKTRKSNYGLGEFVKNIYFLVKTRIYFSKARLVRFPIVIRGKKYIDFGKRLTTGYNCRFEVTGEHEGKILVFGSDVNVGDNVRISCMKKIEVGSGVLIGSRVLIIDNSHGTYEGENQDSPYIPPNKREMCTASVTIGDNVWIGENAVIQKGCTIGRGSIIAANSVVTKDIEKNVIAAGTPAKVIKRYNTENRKWEKV